MAPAGGKTRSAVAAIVTPGTIRDEAHRPKPPASAPIPGEPQHRDSPAACSGCGPPSRNTIRNSSATAPSPQRRWRLTEPLRASLMRGTGQGHQRRGMLPLYAARIDDLGPGDFLKVDCAACHHVALLTPRALLRAGLSSAKVLDLKERLRCRGCGRKGRAVVSIKWRGQGPVSGCSSRCRSLPPPHVISRCRGLSREGAAPGWGDYLDAAPAWLVRPGHSRRTR
jgi:hypothetical protein